MASSPTLRARPTEPQNILNGEIPVGAAKGAIVGTFLAGPVGTLAGGAVGAAITAFGEKDRIEKEQILGKPAKDPGIFNKEALMAFAAMTVLPAIPVIGALVPGGALVTLAVTAAAGFIGKGRMEKEQATARVQTVDDQMVSQQAIAAQQRLAAYSAYKSAGNPGAPYKNSVSQTEIDAAMQAARNGQVKDGGQLQKVLAARQQQQQLQLAGTAS
jgi:hypothetical protein